MDAENSDFVVDQADIDEKLRIQKKKKGNLTCSYKCCFFSNHFC
jgi:hypothetical protein